MTPSLSFETEASTRPRVGRRVTWAKPATVEERTYLCDPKGTKGYGGGEFRPESEARNALKSAASMFDGSDGSASFGPGSAFAPPGSVGAPGAGSNVGMGASAAAPAAPAPPVRRGPVATIPWYTPPLLDEQFCTGQGRPQHGRDVQRRRRAWFEATAHSDAPIIEPSPQDDWPTRDDSETPLLPLGLDVDAKPAGSQVAQQQPPADVQQAGQEQDQQQQSGAFGAMGGNGVGALGSLGGGLGGLAGAPAVGGQPQAEEV